MFFDPRIPFLWSKILKNYGNMARIGPEQGFLLFFGIFTLFLSLKNVKSNERGDMMNWDIDLHSHWSFENIRMDNMTFWPCIEHKMIKKPFFTHKYGINYLWPLNRKHGKNYVQDVFNSHLDTFNPTFLTYLWTTKCMI